MQNVVSSVVKDAQARTNSSSCEELSEKTGVPAATLKMWAKGRGTEKAAAILTLLMCLPPEHNEAVIPEGALFKHFPLSSGETFMLYSTLNLALTLHYGIPEGLAYALPYVSSPETRQALNEISSAVQSGTPLVKAFAESGATRDFEAALFYAEKTGTMPRMFQRRASAIYDARRATPILTGNHAADLRDLQIFADCKTDGIPYDLPFIAAFSDEPRKAAWQAAYAAPVERPVDWIRLTPLSETAKAWLGLGVIFNLVSDSWVTSYRQYLHLLHGR